MASILSGIPEGANFEIVKLLTVPVVKNANSPAGSSIVAHGLDFKPAFLGFFTTNAGAQRYFQTPYVYINPVAGTCSMWAYIETDVTSVTCWFVTPSSESLYSSAFNNAKFYVYLLRQPVYI